MVIGGEDVFRAFVPLAGRLVLTVVDGEFEGTALFPTDDFDRGTFAVTDEQAFAADAKNPYPYTVWQLDRAADGTSGAALLSRLGLD
jgi:dihydrofolate reductase